MQRETLILGIGNPILTADAVVLHAVRGLKKLSQEAPVVNQADLDAGFPREIASLPLDELVMQETGYSHSINARPAIDLGEHC